MTVFYELFTFLLSKHTAMNLCQSCNATFSFTVSSKQHGMNLLNCLLPSIPYLTTDQWRDVLAEKTGGIQVDSRSVFVDVFLKKGQVVSYTINNYQEAEVDGRWSLLWSNDEIAAIHKPANLPVNRTTRNVYNTLIQLLRRESPWPDAHLLHRLDLETSGVMLIAKTNEIARRYQSKLGELIKRKIYRAVVTGKPCWAKKDFTADLSTLDEGGGGSAIRSQMHVVPDGEGKESRTVFRCLSTFEKEEVTYSLIECELFTGRKHQIRAHLAHLGYPIVGDKIYNNNGDFYLKRLDKRLSDVDYKKLLTPHHLLHAYEIHIHNLWDFEGLGSQEIILRDETFPETWQNFMVNK